MGYRLPAFYPGSSLHWNLPVTFWCSAAGSVKVCYQSGSCLGAFFLHPKLNDGRPEMAQGLSSSTGIGAAETRGKTEQVQLPIELPSETKHKRPKSREPFSRPNR